MHSKRHEGGSYEIKDGKTMEITFDPCHKDVSYQGDAEQRVLCEHKTPVSSRPAPPRFL